MPRFEIRSLMIAVGVAAIGFAIMRLEVVLGAYVLAVSFVYALWSLVLQRRADRSGRSERGSRSLFKSLVFHAFAVTISVGIIVGFVWISLELIH